MNSKQHLKFSLFKSGLRIIGCALYLAFGDCIAEFTISMFIIAEIAGVIEEFVDER